MDSRQYGIVKKVVDPVRFRLGLQKNNLIILNYRNFKFETYTLLINFFIKKKKFGIVEIILKKKKNLAKKIRNKKYKI